MMEFHCCSGCCVCTIVPSTRDCTERKTQRLLFSAAEISKTERENRSKKNGGKEKEDDLANF
jgi:hypothetical protein